MDWIEISDGDLGIFIWWCDRIDVPLITSRCYVYLIYVSDCFRCFPYNFLYWKIWPLFQWISLHFHLEQHWDDQSLILQHGWFLLHVILISPAQMPVLETCPMQHCQKPCRTSTNKQLEFERTLHTKTQYVLPIPPNSSATRQPSINDSNSSMWFHTDNLHLKEPWPTFHIGTRNHSLFPFPPLAFLGSWSSETPWVLGCIWEIKWN